MLRTFCFLLLMYFAVACADPSEYNADAVQTYQFYFQETDLDRVNKELIKLFNANDLSLTQYGPGIDYPASKSRSLHYHITDSSSQIVVTVLGQQETLHIKILKATETTYGVEFHNKLKKLDGIAQNLSETEFLSLKMVK